MQSQRKVKKSSKSKNKPDLETLIQQLYNAPNEKLKKMYRNIILRLDPDFKEIK